MTTGHFSGPRKITDAWLEAQEDQTFGGEIMPHCMYCFKPCRKGSYADHLWPYHDEYSFHLACRRRAKKGDGDE